ncbi:hypothetical protein D9M71_720790 [compost metagenome]
MRRVRFVGIAGGVDGVFHRAEGTQAVRLAGMDEQADQRPAHGADRTAPGHSFGVPGFGRQGFLLAAQFDDRQADFLHQEHPAQQPPLHVRSAGGKPVGLVEQVAGAAFETGGKSRQRVADGMHHAHAQFAFQALP